MRSSPTQWSLIRYQDKVSFIALGTSLDSLAQGAVSNSSVQLNSSGVH